MPATALPPEFEARLQREIKPDEKLIWSTRPDLNALQKGNSGCATAIALCLCVGGLLMLLLAFGLFHGPGGLGHGGAILFALVLSGAGGLILYAPTLVRNRMLNTIYAATDKRAFILWPKGKVESFTPTDMSAMKTRLNPDGSGDLIFGYYERTVQGNKQQVPVGFFGLSNAAEVESLLRRTLLPPT